MNPGLRFGLAAIIALTAAWAGAQIYLSRFAHGGEHGVTVPAGEASPVTASEAAAEADAGVPASHEIPEKLPEFKLADLDGHPTSVSLWRGKSLMINFWATWCAPCRREIPLLQALNEEKSGQNVMVLGIAVDYPDKVKAFRDQYKVRYPLLVGEQDALNLAAAFGVSSPAFPFTVFTDNRGEIVTLYLGQLKRRQADAILAVVEDLNRDRVALAAARSRIAASLGEIRNSGS